MNEGAEAEQHVDEDEDRIAVIRQRDPRDKRMSLRVLRKTKKVVARTNSKEAPKKDFQSDADVIILKKGSKKRY